MQVPLAEQAEYWEHYRARGLVSNTDDQCLPIGLHGDDGRYSRSGDKIILVTMNSVLSVPRRTVTAII